MILDGKKLAGEIYEQLKENIIKQENTPTLGAVLVGDNSASLRYIAQKRKFSERIGMNFELFQFPEGISEKDLLDEIDLLNKNPDISGYIVQLPLPDHIDPNKVIGNIDPNKDVDGFHPENLGKVMIGDTTGFVPCTPAGIMMLFDHYNIELLGKNIKILGQSNIVGKPMAQLCINAGATVTSCNSKTKDLSIHTKHADIIIIATGKAHLLTADMVHPECVVIDVGFSVINDVIHGDANTKDFIEQGNSITPVPGGVGPMTVAMLLSNTYKAHINK